MGRLLHNLFNKYYLSSLSGGLLPGRGEELGHGCGRAGAVHQRRQAGAEPGCEGHCHHQPGQPHRPGESAVVLFDAVDVVVC